jgi:hypothetical protein
VRPRAVQVLRMEGGDRTGWDVLGCWDGLLDTRHWLCVSQRPVWLFRGMLANRKPSLACSALLLVLQRAV